MDTILRGLIAGFTGTTVYAAVNWILFNLQILPSTGIHYTARLLNPPNTPLTSLPMLVGIIGFFIAGSFVGVILAYVLRWTGHDYAWLKGFGMGAVLWPVHSAFIPAIVPRVYTTFTPSMALASFLLTSLLGIVAGLVLQVINEKIKVS